MNASTAGLPVHHQFLEFTQTHVHESVMPTSHLILCHPLLLLPPIPPVNQRYVYIYPLFFEFPFHLGHHRALSKVPCAVQ